MSDRSLFNALCKLLGMWLTFQGLTSLVWAFHMSRYTGLNSTDPMAYSEWFSAAVTTAFGVFLCTRSSNLTRFLFRFDGSLDSEEPSDSET